MIERNAFQVEIRDGKPFIDGVDTKLSVDEYETMRVRASDLRAQRFFTRCNDVIVDNHHVMGRGTIDGILKVFGIGASTRSLNLSVGVAPDTDTERFNWHASWGYIAADWETRTSSTWYLEIRLPRSTWEAFQRDYEAGRVAEVSVSVKGSLWTEASPMPALDDTVYYLLPNAYGSAGGGHGSVESFGWGDKHLGCVHEGEHASAIDGEPPAQIFGKSYADNFVRLGAKANVQIAKLLQWSVPAIIVILVIIAIRL